MDIVLPGNGRSKAWSDTMVNLEARKLINTANQLSAFHLHDGLVRIKFVEEIKQVIEQQFAAARHARSDEQRMQCIKNLRAENENLQQQDRLLRTKAAKLYAKVEFIRENNKIIGYVISAVHVVLSGVALFTGFMMISTMTPVGILAGAVLVVDGFNGVSKEIINNSSFGENANSQGIFADGAMETANFLGFTPKSGLAFYNSMTLTASVYSIVGLSLKNGAWRLFRWLPKDYYRQVDTMSRPKLTMKIVGYGLKAKVIFDLITTDNNPH